MRKTGSGWRLSAVAMGIITMVAVAASKETSLKAQAAELPVVKDVEVAASPDNTGVIARCSYQNYTDQSGCEMRLYLYKIENGRESIESQKALAYAEQGNDSTQSRQVDDGMYRASVTIDDGVDIRQINSSKYYWVSRIEGSYIVTEETDSENFAQMESEAEQQGESDTYCSHACEYVLLEQATPVKDAVQAYQCTKCSTVFEYIDVPNSAYAAFLKEAVSLIQNAQQKEVLIVTDRWVSFNREVFEAMKMRPDLSVKIIYRYHGEECSLVIPAEIDVDLLMDENGFGGFQYIEEILRQYNN